MLSMQNNFIILFTFNKFNKFKNNLINFFDLGAKSVELVSLMMEIQSNYNCNISDNDAVNLRTVADTVKYVQENRDS